MSIEKRIPLSLFLGVAVLAPPARDARAQDSTAVEYAVKIICGAPNRPALARGQYFTAINVHNPGTDSVSFRQKFATTRPGEVPGPVSPFTGATLGPDQALEIDCTDMARRSREHGFFKGFAVLQSPRELDVVAVYTAAPAADRPVVALEVERFPGRRTGRTVCTLPDLVVDSILRPTFVQATRGSRIDAIIRNLGPGAAAASTARLIDPSTFVSPGVPYSAVASTPPLAPGASATVTFSLPYWVFNPDASLEVTADYKNDVAECREDNNVKTFEAVG
ncbi:MAG TPA: CARDB domain-containing protein [Gemmatimonadaceae bacterium]